jgi:vacuolar protein sorting-associated protein VTA1
MYASVPSPPSPPVSPPDLTPQLIAKAQKHCRFAISALDYEDADQARKELRAALAVLEG